MINILLPQNLTAENFAGRLAQANLVTKADFDNRIVSLNRNINSNKTKIFSLKMNLIQFILEINVILKEMAHKIIYYLNQCIDLLKKIVVLAMVDIHFFKYLRVCLMKELILLLYLIMVLLKT